MDERTKTMTQRRNTENDCDILHGRASRAATRARLHPSRPACRPLRRAVTRKVNHGLRTSNQLEPRPGAQGELLELLEELDATLASAPGLLLSLVVSQDAHNIGRISVWRSKEDANREAISDHTLALRSRLRYLSVRTEERLLELTSGHFPQGFAAIMRAPKLAAYFPTDARQPSLPIVA